MDGQVLTPWIYRRWRFDFPAELYPAVLERLRGLPARVDEIVSALTPAHATHTPAQGWSIQQHIGHLADLEALLAQRLDAYEAGAPVLPPADCKTIARSKRVTTGVCCAMWLRSFALAEVRRLFVLTPTRGIPLRVPLGMSAWGCPSAS